MVKPDIFQLQKTFYADRPSMDIKNNDVPFLMHRLQLEADELVAEPEEGMDKVDYIENEAVDVILFAMQIIRAIGRDPEEAIRFKLAFNTSKFLPILFDKEVPYDVGYLMSRQNAVETHLKGDFYGEVSRPRD